MPAPRYLPGSSPAAWLLALGLAALLPRPATALSVVSASRDYAIEVQLGGGVYDGDQCVQSSGVSAACQEQLIVSGALDPALPLLESADVSVESFPTFDDGVRGIGTAGLSAAFNVRDPNVFAVTQSVGFTARDSRPASFHTSVDGFALASSSIVLETSLDLLPSQALELTFALSVIDEGMASLFSATYAVVDLDTGQTLASLSLADPGSVTLDVTSLIGHSLETSFQGEVELHLPAGFGGGAELFVDRDFPHLAAGRLTLEIVPEPSTAALVALGLGGLGLRRRGARAERARLFES